MTNRAWTKRQARRFFMNHKKPAILSPYEWSPVSGIVQRRAKAAGLCVLARRTGNGRYTFALCQACATGYIPVDYIAGAGQVSSIPMQGIKEQLVLWHRALRVLRNLYIRGEVIPRGLVVESILEWIDEHPGAVYTADIYPE